MTKIIEFELIDNAFDYLLSAAEHAKKGTPRDLKYAILHLVAGIELLLKSRLEKEHWSLLFADPDKATKDAVESGDFKTVDFDSACKRLVGAAGVLLSKDDLKHLRELRLLRHKVQHFAIQTPLQQVNSLVGKGLNFALDFSSAHLTDAIGSHETEIDAIKKQLTDLQSFIAARIESLAPQLRKETRLLECPRCWQKTMACDGEEPHCLFCGFECDWETYTRDHSEDGEVLRCPECSEEACTIIVFNNDEAGWFCFACDTHGDYVRCLRCKDNLTAAEDSVCSDCWDALMKKDE